MDIVSSDGSRSDMLITCGLSNTSRRLTQLTSRELTKRAKSGTRCMPLHHLNRLNQCKQKHEFSTQILHQFPQFPLFFQCLFRPIHPRIQNSRNGKHTSHNGTHTRQKRGKTLPCLGVRDQQRRDFVMEKESWHGTIGYTTGKFSLVEGHCVLVGALRGAIEVDRTRANDFDKVLKVGILFGCRFGCTVQRTRWYPGKVFTE